MSTITFNTLDFMNELKQGGIKQNEAGAITKATEHALSEMVSISEFATKKDIHKLEANIHNSEIRLIKWIAGMALGQVTLTIGLMELLKWHS